ncbi:FAD-dependent oxidoreductase [Streptomyces sp. NPDC101118]|uniref:FAD-dependent oxidoreductase n=1 Tax=Streptomyces sp. NPDC101118 TaxID=3366109 RepID=UPI003818902C
MTGPGVVVVGNGTAGRAVAERLVARGVAVTVLGEEAAYHRPLLAGVLSGALPAAALELPPVPGTRAGVRVTGLDLARRVVRCADGTEVPYAQLVLATGTVPRLPELPGIDGPGVVVPRTAAACAALPEGAAVVLGGGPLAVEAAFALRRSGREVALVHRGPWPLDRHLGARAGAALAGRLTAAGVSLHLDAEAAEYVPGKLLLADGTVLPADVLLPCTGASPDTTLADAAGLPTATGILVDASLRTPDPHVWSLGGCAQPVAPREFTAVRRAHEAAGTTLARAAGWATRSPEAGPEANRTTPAPEAAPAAAPTLAGPGAARPEPDAAAATPGTPVPPPAPGARATPPPPTRTTPAPAAPRAETATLATPARAPRVPAPAPAPGSAPSPSAGGTGIAPGLDATQPAPGSASPGFDTVLRQADTLAAALATVLQAEAGPDHDADAPGTRGQAPTGAGRGPGTTTTATTATATATATGMTDLLRLQAPEADVLRLGTLDGAHETVTFSDPARHRHAEVALWEGRLAGAVTVGLPHGAAALTRLHASGAPAPRDLLALLLGTPAVLPRTTDPLDDVICHCNNVTGRHLAEAHAAGTRTRAGTGCGGCAEDVRAFCSTLVPTTNGAQ